MDSGAWSGVFGPPQRIQRKRSKTISPGKSHAPDATLDPRMETFGPSGGVWGFDPIFKFCGTQDDQSGLRHTERWSKSTHLVNRWFSTSMIFQDDSRECRPILHHSNSSRMSQDRWRPLAAVVSVSSSFLPGHRVAAGEAACPRRRRASGGVAASVRTRSAPRETHGWLMVQW